MTFQTRFVDSESLLACIDSYQILGTLLATFSTQALLPLTLVSKRFHSIIVRLLHYRLLVASELPEYQLLVEAYHPTRKWLHPYMICTHLETNGLSPLYEGEGSLYEDCDDHCGRLERLSSLYSRFTLKDADWPRARPPIPTMAMGAQTQPISSLAAPAVNPVTGEACISRDFALDRNELFSQFCAYGTLVLGTARQGVYMSTAKLVRDGEGVTRIWRQWLQDRAKESVERDEILREFGEEGAQAFAASCAVGSDQGVRWTDCKQNFGFRCVVRDRTVRDDDAEDEEDPPLNFAVEITELVIRTTHLLLAVEALQKQSRRPGKATVFGSWLIEA